MGLTEKNGTEMVLPMTCTSIKTGVLYYSETPDFFFFLRKVNLQYPKQWLIFWHFRNESVARMFAHMPRIESLTLLVFLPPLKLTSPVK